MKIVLAGLALVFATVVATYFASRRPVAIDRFTETQQGSEASPSPDTPTVSGKPDEGNDKTDETKDKTDTADKDIKTKKKEIERSERRVRDMLKRLKVSSEQPRAPEVPIKIK